MEVAEAALQRLAAPAAFDTESFLEDRRNCSASIENDCPVINTPLRQLSDLFSTLKAVVGGIRRRARTPSPGDRFSGDECYVMTENATSTTLGADTRQV
jgi:trk system potassium uptake protein TrkA